jgi:hypothetical protein
MEMYIFFPSFILEVDTPVDCHISYEPLGRLAILASLDYIQPASPQPSAYTTTKILSALVRIEPDGDNSVAPTFANHWPKKPLSPAPINIDLNLIPPLAYLIKLKDLAQDKLIRHLFTVETKQQQV